MPAFGTTATSLTFGGAGTVGTAATLSRSDHTHTLPAAAASTSDYAGVVSFSKSTEYVYAAIPAGVTKMYVESRWTDVTATMTLRIAAAATPTTTTSITTSTSGTTISSFAGAAVAFSVSGMSASATRAVIGVRMS
jgi:hypothetical protein